LCGEERPLQVARELTKLHEQQIGPTIGEALRYFLSNKPIGECTLVLGGAPAEFDIQLSQSEMLAKMKKLVKNGASSNEAARTLAQETGQSKRLLYALLHE